MSLIHLTATEQAQLLAQKKLSARECLDAHLAQIEAVNPKVNALIYLDTDGAKKQALAIDERRARGETLSAVAGLPIAIKDMERVTGMPQTFGSPIFKNNITDSDGLMVERLRGHGCVILGKSNVPEFSMGSHTFNTVFGPSRNPYNLSKTPGGSTGGGAVAVRTHMLPFCDGSDLGGSLRNPGNFNNLIGLRPTPGRVPIWPTGTHWNPLGVYGPIARTAHDCALLLSAQAGGDARNPLSLWDDPKQFLAPLARDFKGVKVAYSLDMGGTPMEPEVKRVLNEGLKYLQTLGVELVEDCPDFAEADAAFAVLRAFFAAQTWGPTYHKNKAQMKDTAIWNIEKGLALSAQEVSDALLMQSRVYERMRLFMQRYEFFVGPVNQVLPFDISTPYPTEINGTSMPDYVEWMQSASRITSTLHPALSCPIGFSHSGLPVGLQIVGRYRDELGLLQFAHAIEQVTELSKRVPTLA